MKQIVLTPTRQQGIALWHILLLVVVAVGFALFVNAKGIGFFTRLIPDNLHLPRFSGDNVSHNYDNTRTSSRYDSSAASEPYHYYRKPSIDTQTSAASRAAAYAYLASDYDLNYPPNLENGYYTVQVFSGYNSRTAFALQRDLRRDGYRSFIDEKKDHRGILFRVRVGQYPNRSDAFAVRDKIRGRYPRTLGSSFVMQINSNS